MDRKGSFSNIDHHARFAVSLLALFADLLFPGLKLPMAGQHGCERRDGAGAIYLHAPVKRTQAKLRKLLRSLAKRHPQLGFEDKGAVLALHYRGTPQLASHLHRTLRQSLAEDDGYELQPGKLLLEVRPEGATRGAAIDDFMAGGTVCGSPPGLCRRRSDRRARVCGRGHHGRLDDQGVGPGRCTALRHAQAFRSPRFRALADRADFGFPRPRPVHSMH
jgi:hypothetical protein